MAPKIETFLKDLSKSIGEIERQIKNAEAAVDILKRCKDSLRGLREETITIEGMIENYNASIDSLDSIKIFTKNLHEKISSGNGWDSLLEQAIKAIQMFHGSVVINGNTRDGKTF